MRLIDIEGEKPIVLRYVDLMRKAYKRRERERGRGAGWGCCDQFGHLSHVNGIPRVVKDCPHCKPLKRHPHICKLNSDGPERYERMKEWRRKVKNINKLAAILKSNAADHPYRGSMTPLCDFRGSWNSLVVEYYHRERDGKTVLQVRAKGAPADRVDVNVIRQTFGVPASVEPDQKAREDGTYEDRFEWKPVKQMVLA